MKILLIYPRYPDTFWSFRYAMKFIGRKASFPPLGLMTVAAMLPEPWEKRLVDMNVRPLADSDLRWADYVFVSAMTIQRQSALEVIKLFREYRPRRQRRFHYQPGYAGALFKSMLYLGVLGRERGHFWKLFFWSLFRKPRLFPLAITYAVYGFHFRKVAEKIRGCGMFDGNAPWNEKDGYV